MNPSRLFLCNGARLTSELKSEDQSVKTLDTAAPAENVHLHIDNVTRAFETSLNARIIDLLEIAAYIFTADCAAKRTGAWIEHSVEQWGRDMKLAVAVRDLEFWSRESVSTALRKAINFMTSDSFTFEFTALTRELPIQRYLGITRIDETPFYGIDRVTLFSGGLDSLAGAAQAAAAGEALALVSHRPVRQTDKRQLGLVAKLRKTFHVPILHNPVWVNKTKLDREDTQRSRVFLFGALAGAVASFLDAKGIRLYENGIVSLNWSLADEVLQSRASRTTHPLSLYLLQDLLRLVLDKPDFVVENPFVFQTKTEIVQALMKAGCPELIAGSCSCVRTLHTASSASHCGLCGQCTDRYVAVLAAGAEVYDPAHGYKENVFTGPRTIKGEHVYDHNIAVDYTRYAREMHTAHDFQIAERYSNELVRASRHFPEPRVAADQFIAMQKRHGDTVINVLAKQVAIHAKEVACGTLEPTSLLAMVVRDNLEFAVPETSRSLTSTADPYTPSEPIRNYVPGRESENRVESDIPSMPSPTTKNAFRRDGGVWIVEYAGKQKLIEPVAGLPYIRALLSNPGQPIESMSLVQLYGRVRKNAGAADAVDVVSISAADAEQSGVVAVGMSADPVLGPDGSYLDSMRKELRDAQQRLTLAEKSGKAGDVANAQRRVSEIRRLMISGTGRRGASRQFDSAASKARASVKTAISRAVTRIGSSHPELGMHLKNGIKTGASCCYAPDERIFWDT